MNGITISPTELFLGGMAAVVLLYLIVKARSGNRRARAAAQVAEVGTRAVSLLGRTLIGAGVIVGAQWVVITYAAANVTLLLVVLAVPALLASATLARLLTVTEVRSTRAGGRR